MVIRSEILQAESVLTLPSILLPDRRALKNQRFQGSHAKVLDVQSEFKRPFEPPTGDVFKHRLDELLLVGAPIRCNRKLPAQIPMAGGSASSPARPGSEDRLRSMRGASTGRE